LTLYISRQQIRFGGRRIYLTSPRIILGALSNPKSLRLLLRLLNLRPWPGTIRENGGTRIIQRPRDAWDYFSMGRLTRVNEVDTLVQWGGKKAVIRGGELAGDLRGVFIEEEYRVLPVQGREVFDVGAAAGDSAIYFLMRGASKVHAFELEESSIQYLRETLGEAVAEGKATVTGGRVSDMNSTLSRSGVVDGSLKMDIEGDERGVFRSADREIWRRALQYICMEWHYDKEAITKELDRLGYRYRFLWGPWQANEGFWFGGLFAWRVGQ
jgi:hypothetical protein